MSVYAVSDLHGRLDLYQKIKEFLKPGDKVYCLGDCGDRGPEPWKTIETIYKDPQFIYLKGNHEDMLIKAINEYYSDNESCYSQRLLYANGGGETLEQVNETGMALDWARALNELPTYETYTNKCGLTFLMSHAGFTPTTEELTAGVVKRRDKDLLWDRVHYIFDDRWPENGDDFVVVHGHTPIPHMIDEIYLDCEWEEGALWYCDDHKVCLDQGAVWTGKTVLLNLDTLDDYVFTI